MEKKFIKPTLIDLDYIRNLNNNNIVTVPKKEGKEKIKTEVKNEIKISGEDILWL